ncbi:MAG: DUF1080 domain-containing protein [Planctomycetota bacterium]|nr:DUF1080 domain-containing protein [Planctomycetota bacterium]
MMRLTLAIPVFLFLILPGFSSAEDAKKPEAPTVEATKEAPKQAEALQTPAEQIKTLVAGFDGKLPQDRTKVLEEFVKGGKPFVDELVGQIVKPGTGEDTSARFVLRYLSFHVMRDGSPGDERQTLLNAHLATINDATKDYEVKGFSLREIQFLGRDESVAPVATLLLQENLTEESTMCLLALSKNIGSEKVITPLRDALAKANDQQKPTFGRALGMLRDKQSLPALAEASKSEDSNTRLMALHALANIADPSSESILLDAAANEKGYNRQRATTWTLMYARNLAKADKGKASEVCHKLLKARPGPEDGHVQSSTLYTLYDIQGNESVDVLVNALDTKNTYVRIAVGKLLASIPDASVTAKVAARLKHEKPEIRTEVLDVLAWRGDAAAAPAISEAIKDTDEKVRLTAIHALSKTAKAEALPQLLALVKGTDPKAREAARQALAYLPGDQVGDRLAEAYKTEEQPEVRKILIEMLHIKGGQSHTDTFFAAAEDKDGAVRSAAFKTLRSHATEAQVPQLLEILLKLDAGEQEQISHALVAATKQIEDPKRQTELILKRFSESKGKDRVSLLKVLGRLEGPDALTAVVTETKSEEADMQTEAVRVLSGWQDNAALSHLFTVAKDAKDMIQHVLALRGYVRLVEQYSMAVPLSNWKEVLKNYKDPRSLPGAVSKPYGALNAALKVARRDEEKSLIALRMEPLGGSTENAAKGKKVSFGLVHKPHSPTVQLNDGNFLPADGRQEYLVGTLGTDFEVTIDMGELVMLDEITFRALQDTDGATFFPRRVEFLVSGDGQDFESVAAIDLEENKDSRPQIKSISTPKLGEVLAQHIRVKAINIGTIPDWHQRKKQKAWIQSDELIVKLKESDKKPESAKPEAKKAEAKPTEQAKAESKPDEPYQESYIDQDGTENCGIPDDEFVALFDGKTLTGWQGNLTGHAAENGILVATGGRLFTEKEYSDFVFKFEFKLPPGANNGLGIRTPVQGDPAYAGMELQILDNGSPQYARLQPYQYHGSIYGVSPAKRGLMKKPGEWNRQEVIAIGHHIRVILNGHTITDTYLDKVKPMDKRPHAGMLNKKGYIGFLGYGARIEFKEIKIKDYALSDPMPKLEGLNVPPAGYKAEFNGKDLTHWKGLVKDPKARAAMTPEQLAEGQIKADEVMKSGWSVVDGNLEFSGKGQSLCTAKDYGDFDMYVDWKIHEHGDSGIYLRGTPQVQIWDPNQHKIGSGGLYNNQKNPSKPIVAESKDPNAKQWADNPIGEWNTFYIRMVGENVSIYLNGTLVVDDTVLENYWERDKPIYSTGQIELQNHGNKLYFRNVFLRELPR